MQELQRRIEEAKQQAFLRQVLERSGGDVKAEVPSGTIGQQLGLPYEQALSIVAALEARGLLHAQAALSPPSGPMVHITRRGIDSISESAA